VLIDLVMFRLAAGTDVETFLDADRRVQTELIPNLHGFVRRTTARGAEGEWAVITLWWSEEDADAAAAHMGGDPIGAAFDAMVDPASVTRRRYTTLD
jgi:hypothetical protein